MELKKNDKIILIVGVTVLIISAIGIALYTSPSGERGVGEFQPSMKTFSYTWRENVGDKSFGEKFVNKKTPFEDTFNISVDKGDVLTTVSFHLTWQDDVTYGILIKKGLDTMDAKISYGGINQKNSSKGSGDYWFNFTINSRPKDDTVLAMNESDALQAIKESVSGKNTASFESTISIKTGERIIHLLKYIKDKGNNFELSAYYTYYSISSFEELENDTEDNGGGNNVSEGSDLPLSGHGIGEFYRNLGYGRGMI